MPSSAACKVSLPTPPYELVGDRELHYQNVLFIVFKLVGFYTQVEYHTSEGRVDLVLKTDRYIYIMEFKFEGTAEEALRQIDEKALRATLRSRRSPTVQDRRELQRPDAQHRKVADKKHDFLPHKDGFSSSALPFAPPSGSTSERGCDNSDNKATMRDKHRGVKLGSLYHY